MNPNQRYSQPAPGQFWRPQPQAWNGAGISLRPTFPQPYPQAQLPSYPRDPGRPSYYPNQLSAFQQPGPAGGANYGFPAPPYQPYPGPFATPQPPRRNRSRFPLAATILVLALVCGVIYSLTRGGGGSTQLAGEYQNETWQVPPANSTPPELPVPENLRQARSWLTNNALYDVSLASPVRCELELLPGYKVSDERLQQHLEEYMECLTRTWGPAVEEAGLIAYQPRVTVYPQGKEVSTACGDAPSMNAFYCGVDQRLYIAQDILDLLSTDAADGRTVFNLIMAHEYGHAMQGRAGILVSMSWLASESSSDEALELSRRSEVQADCFAGLALGSLWQSLGLNEQDHTDILQAVHEIGDDQLAERLQLTDNGSRDHGSGSNRRLWTERGLNSHAVGTCNAFSAPANEVS